MSTVTIFRKYTNSVIKNDISPMDKAALRDLKAKLEKASDEMDENETAATEAAFKAAQKKYDDFINKVTPM